MKENGNLAKVYLLRQVGNDYPKHVHFFVVREGGTRCTRERTLDGHPSGHPQDERITEIFFRAGVTSGPEKFGNLIIFHIVFAGGEKL